MIRMNTIKRLWKDEEGVVAVEYALLLVLVVMATVTAWQGLASHIVNGVNQAANALDTASTTTTR
jgi:Flp pilus assembly pilin Flp